MGAKLTGDLIKSIWLRWIIIVASILILALVLSWISSGFQGVAGWLSFLLVGLLGMVILAGGWRLLQGETPPRWLLGLSIGAALLRLAAGMVWFTVLPIAGYNSSPEQYGYVMADAYDRDRSAWELASSDKPLLKAFQGGFRKADQYGGMLFLSASVYRFAGGQTHQPLLMVVITAAFSALAVAFSWGFARRAWGEAAAYLAAWGLALYPEAILVGSSQMREAFLVTLAIVAAYGLLKFAQERSLGGMALILGSLVLSLPLSPPSTALLLVILVLQAIAMGKAWLPSGWREQRWFWPALVGAILLVGIGLWLALLQFAPAGVTSPISVVSWWIKKSADWNAYLSERASGWVQKIFDSTPEWTHMPLLVLYGVIQPFLPAAVIDVTGAPVWRLIAIWRAAGWTLLLPLLLYATLRALRPKSSLSASQGLSASGERVLSLAVWLVILVASFRGGGDAWDNPRYRLTFAGLQIALVAWAWAEQRRLPDPWLRRVIIGLGLVLAWFVPWYLRRYLHMQWPVADFFMTLGLGLASAALYWIGDWGLAKFKQRKQSDADHHE